MFWLELDRWQGQCSLTSCSRIEGAQRGGRPIRGYVLLFVELHSDVVVYGLPT